MKILKKSSIVILSLIMIITMMTPVSFAGTSPIKLSETSISFNHAYTHSVDVTYSGTRSLYFDVIDGEDEVNVKWEGEWSGNTTKLNITPRLNDEGSAKILVYEDGRRSSGRTIRVEFDNCNTLAKFCDDHIYLAWSKKLLNDNYVDYYKVYKSKEKNGSYWCIDDEVYGRSTEDYEVAHNRTYYYKIKAIYYDGDVKISSPFKIVIPLADPGLKLSVTGSHSITLKWNKVSGADGYRIYRSAPDLDHYKVVKTITDSDVTSWTNKDLTTGKTKYYKIRAFKYGLDGEKIYGEFSSMKKATPRKNAYYENPSYEFDEYGGVNLRTREVCYDSNGNLVYRALALNDRMFYAKDFNWIRITIYADGMRIGSQKFYDRYIGLDPYDYKMLKFTLDKGTFKKNVNLRYADVSVAYEYNYNYLY